MRSPWTRPPRPRQTAPAVRSPRSARSSSVASRRWCWPSRPAPSVSMTKSVTITVDGTPVQVSTLSGSVAGALDSAGLAVGEHDVLAPGRRDADHRRLHRDAQPRPAADRLHRRRPAADLDHCADRRRGRCGSRHRHRSGPDHRRPVAPDPARGHDAHRRHAAHREHLRRCRRGCRLSLPGATVADVLAAEGHHPGCGRHRHPGARDCGDRRPRASPSTARSSRPSWTTETIAQPADVTTEDPNLNRGTTAVTVQGAPGTAR